MNGAVFDEALKKKVYFFNGNTREEFESVTIGSTVEVEVKDVQKKAVMVLKFRVTRDTHLGMRQRWVYGKLLNDPASEYYQEVQIRLHMDEPESDSIWVFPKAPPISSASF